MAVLFAVLIPALMLGVVLALGRYEELVLPGADPQPGALDPVTAPPAPPGAADIPAPSP
ncbi:hypothetical protein SUDANB58_04969 [Streptomyces sp. enrichment culture]|uniref:hypothetical protein n=1 Tax=Streptomyces sp. enrichment culture TaxID=1795815 RepID=UPI003F544C77